MGVCSSIFYDFLKIKIAIGVRILESTLENGECSMRKAKAKWKADTKRWQVDVRKVESDAAFIVRFPQRMQRKKLQSGMEPRL